VAVVPTATDAERLAHDLGAFLGPDQVDLFPAWETLPFERVSPSIETMGRRLRTMWRLRHADDDPDVVPRVILTPVKAVLQRLGPQVEDVDPIVVRRGDQIDPTDLVTRLGARGYGR
jgi:transcription-repair coupling factor (superfamily II helicase)